jgi:dipeptidyl-peptidase-4
MLTVTGLLFCLYNSTLKAQDRLKTMPGYEQYKKMSPYLQFSRRPGGSASAFVNGTLNVTWKEDGKSFDYQFDGKRYTYNVSKKKAVVTGDAPAGGPGGFGMRPSRMGRAEGYGPRPERGRQWTAALAPDKSLKAFYSERNLWLSDTTGANKIAVTTEGNEKGRIKYGTASWTYGEELGQTTAMWWSPDSKRIAYYRFDESKTPDYYLQYKQLSLQDSVEIEPYTKVGANNPEVNIFIYDVASKTKVKVDVRDGKPFDNTVVGHYIYDISWTDGGKELMFHRTNRLQNIMELCAADPATGKVRVIIREEWPASFVENSPMMIFLKDNNRFIWESERTGFKNYYLYDLSGKLIATLTNHKFEVAGIVKVDEDAETIYYMARDGENHMKLQLHKVGLNGKGDKRLTDPAYNHSVNISPNNKYFVDVAQTHDIAPFTQLVDMKGKVVEVLAKSDLAKFDELGLKKTELFTFKSTDGKYDLYGTLNFPSNFDPNKKYPVLVSVYGGPGTNAASESFRTPSALAEFGFIIASFDSRGCAQRGKQIYDEIYGHMGTVEMQDQAAGVKALYDRPYIDKNHVGIFGTSYGGASSATCLLKFPDVFQAASAMSGVYDWRNYDNIYTERTNGLPDANKAGYDEGNPINYAKDLKGRLMLYYGTSDNNVHPSNTMQLIQALQKAGKSFEVQVGPDMGHTALNQDRMMEFFIENLVIGK